MKISKFFVLFLFLFSASFSVKAQELSAYNGFWSYEYYQDDERIDKKKFEEILYSDDEAKKIWRDSKTLEGLAYLGLGVEIAGGVWLISDARNGRNITASSIVFGAGFIGGLILIFNSQKKKKDAILRYNSTLDKKTSFKIEPSKSGVGLVLKF